MWSKGSSISVWLCAVGCVLQDCRGHFVLRQLCTMRNPCEVYIHMAEQIERHYAAAAATARQPAADEASTEVSPVVVALSAASGSAATKAISASTAAAVQKSPRSGDEDSQARQPITPDTTAEQTLQFLHQIVQALSIDLLSAKVSSMPLERRGGPAFPNTPPSPSLSRWLVAPFLLHERT